MCMVIKTKVNEKGFLIKYENFYYGYKVFNDFPSDKFLPDGFIPTSFFNAKNGYTIMYENGSIIAYHVIPSEQDVKVFSELKVCSESSNDFVFLNEEKIVSKFEGNRLGSHVYLFRSNMFYNEDLRRVIVPVGFTKEDIQVVSGNNLIVKNFLILRMPTKREEIIKMTEKVNL